MALDVTLGGAVMAGLLSFLSPCILPLVPSYLCFLAGASLDELTSQAPDAMLLRRTIFRAAAFVLGFGTVFVMFGTSASLIGKLLAEHLTLLSRIAGGIIVIFGLHFLGILRIPFLHRQARFQFASRPLSLVGAFVIGLAFAFGWTPCVGPVLASILFVAGAEETATQGATLLAAYALGIGVPFLLAAVFIRPFINFLTRFRTHVGIMEKVMGLMLVATGILILMGSMSTIAGWLLEAFPILGKIG